MTTLETLLESKRHAYADAGFNPVFMPDKLFPFQSALVEWAVRKGRAALFADCGLGKSAMQLTFAQNIVQKTARPVLLLTPLAVGGQMLQEAEKFGVEAERSKDGKFTPGARVVIANYERLHLFNANDFSGLVCDESGILKNYSGATRNAVIAFTKSIQYRLLATATPAPNDVTELGNSVEALGVMRRVDMLARYFIHDSSDTGKWRIKGHASDAYWAFVASWARAVRHPMDIGFDQTGYDLPLLKIETNVLSSKAREGYLFAMDARTLNEQREERKSTISERCDAVAQIASSDSSRFIAWCSLNDESAMLANMIPGAVELSGSDADDEKEEKISAFSNGQIQTLVTKPKICSHGINWQSCHRMSFFPSHSHEQFYQAVRRCWRFGQPSPVEVHIVTTEAEAMIVENLRRKEREAAELFGQIVKNMSVHHITETTKYQPNKQLILPSWLS